MRDRGTFRLLRPYRRQDQLRQVRGVEPCDHRRNPWSPSSYGGNNSTLDLATRVEKFASQATAPAILQVLSERMMGLEPTTFCMANASERSLAFAPVR